MDHRFLAAIVIIAALAAGGCNRKTTYYGEFARFDTPDNIARKEEVRSEILAKPGGTESEWQETWNAVLEELPAEVKVGDDGKFLYRDIKGKVVASGTYRAEGDLLTLNYELTYRGKARKCVEYYMFDPVAGTLTEHFDRKMEEGGWVTVFKKR